MRSASILILTLACITASLVKAQSVDVFGYLEPQLMSVSLKDEYSQLFSNKLRVDLETETDNVHFGANFDYITYRGQKTWDLQQYIPDEVINATDSSALQNTSFEYRDSVYLDNAYLKFSKSIFDITVGKQQFSTGTGYAWNPTDLLNNKDLIDPTYEQPGHTAIRIDAALPGRYIGTAIYFPEDNWEKSGKLLKLKGHLSHFDYSMIYVEKNWPYISYDPYYMVDDNRKLYGGDIVGQVFSLGVWSEFGYNTHKAVDNFWEVLFGTDYTFDSGLYVMAEYYRNELGKDDYKQYDFNDWLHYLTGDFKTISTDNLYLYADYPLTDYVHLGNSFITSISDQSVSVVPSLTYSMYQNVELDVFLNFNIGSEGKAYFSDQGYSGIARFKVYF